MGYIYLITNTVTNKKYVGQTIQDDVRKRWQIYKHKTHNQKSIGNYFYNALCKYPIEKFKFQIICICFDEDCNEFEKHYIKKFNTLSPNGYNLHEGGKNSLFRKKTQLTDEQKRGLFGRYKGIQAKSMFEKHCSESHKRKLSEKLKGRKINKTWNTCKSYKVEKYDSNHNLLETFDSLASAAKTINTIGAVIRNNSNKDVLYHGFYWKTIEVTNSNNSGDIYLNSLTKYRESIKRKVQQLDLNGNYITEYNSLSEASKAVGGVGISYISLCVSDNPRYQTFKGFKWKLV
jgi:group I intron endonuclease